MPYKFLVIICLLALSSCVNAGSAKKRDEKFTLTKITYQNLPGWNSQPEENGGYSQALAAFKKSCTKIKINPQSLKPLQGGVNIGSREWGRVCNEANKVSNAREFFENNFTPYIAAKGGVQKALITGYFETELKGSREQKAPYIYPIYKAPQGLKPGEKYYTREEINNGALKDKNLEIAWVEDQVRLFFLHVQGSGRIKLDDGSVMQVGFAAKNNQEYVSIGKYLAERGQIDAKTASKDVIEKWLKSHPSEIKTVLEKNPSYIFFREIRAEGPIGAQGVDLTPMASLAVDNSIINYGTPIWVDSKLNNNNLALPLQKLFIAQDTGSAIKGMHLDIFFGYGAESEHLAGYQNSPGRYFLLLPKK